MITNEPGIFDYFDYTKFLRDYYTFRHSKERWFSYRYIHQKTGIDPGFLYKIFQGKRHLPQKAAAKLSTLLNFSKKEGEYFDLMISFAKAKSSREIKLYFEKMLNYASLGCKKVDAHAYEYYTKWYYAAIRHILFSYKFKGDYEALAGMTIPKITVVQARKAVELLEKLKFIRKKKSGIYELTEEYLTTGEEWKSIAVRAFQKDTINLAGKALDTIPREQRDVSTVTVSISRENFLKAREIIKSCRKEILQLAQAENDPEKVYHINMQMMPIGNCREGSQ